MVGGSSAHSAGSTPRRATASAPRCKRDDGTGNPPLRSVATLHVSLVGAAGPGTCSLFNSSRVIGELVKDLAAHGRHARYGSVACARCENSVTPCTSGCPCSPQTHLQRCLDTNRALSTTCILDMHRGAANGKSDDTGRGTLRKWAPNHTLARTHPSHTPADADGFANNNNRQRIYKFCSSAARTLISRAAVSMYGSKFMVECVSRCWLPRRAVRKSTMRENALLPLPQQLPSLSLLS